MVLVDASLALISGRIAECMDEWRAKKMIGIHISSMGAFKATDVNFLKDYPDVTSVIVSEGDAIDLRGLLFLKGLTNLGLTNNQKPVPLSEFKELKSFTGDWSPSLDLGVHCRSLESDTRASDLRFAVVLFRVLAFQASSGYDLRNRRIVYGKIISGKIK